MLSLCRSLLRQLAIRHPFHDPSFLTGFIKYSPYRLFFLLPAPRSQLVRSYLQNYCNPSRNLNQRFNCFVVGSVDDLAQVTIWLRPRRTTFIEQLEHNLWVIIGNCIIEGSFSLEAGGIQIDTFIDEQLDHLKEVELAGIY